MSSIVRARRAIGVAALVVAISAAALMAGGAGAGSQSPLALPRQSTLFTSGTAWGPFASFNPLRSERSTGTVGLLYETLFRYDPLGDKYIPWLATSGKWVGRTYVMTVRPGVKWNDGKPLTGADVKFTFETGKLAGSEYSTMWKTGLSRINVKGNTVSFVFSGRPNYLDWDTNMYTIPIVPRHIWSGYSATEITTGNTDTVSKMVGTGPFRYGAGKGTSGTLQWNRRNDWWATKALGITHADALHRRHSQHAEHGVAAELPAEQHRPEQQLLPRHREADRREGPDVLQEGAVHALGQHGVARSEHDEEAAQRQSLPSCARDVGQHRPDRERPATGRSSRRRIPRASCRRGTSGSTRRRWPSWASSTTSRAPRRSSPRTGIETPTTTATSRTRTGRASTCGSSCRTAGPTG